MAFILSPTTLRAQVPEPNKSGHIPRGVATDPDAATHASEFSLPATPTDVQKFCEDLAHGVKTGEVGNFSAWMWETATSDMKQRQVRSKKEKKFIKY